MPTQSGHEWWIVVHELALAEGRLRKLRPIHVFTHLAQYLLTKERDKIFGYCHALENSAYHFQMLGG